MDQATKVNLRRMGFEGCIPLFRGKLIILSVEPLSSAAFPATTRWLKLAARFFLRIGPFWTGIYVPILVF